ncbi:hypothetical protein BBJ28_00019630 [Nothophytophthora sp. Chile5]|nr:hypothetical protein BBJ28_00019630 [Nothophytophthora sp. Chile5]
MESKSLSSSADEGGVAMDFTSADMLPEKAFFPKDYIAQYRRQINELIKRMEHLLEEEDNFEVEGDACIEWNGVQLASLSSETVWHNLCALNDCNTILDGTVELFKQKIRESVDIVATDPEPFVLERTQSSSSIPLSEYSSDDVDETDDEVLDSGFQDVDPVKSRKEAVALNNDVTERVRNALGNDDEEFERFKAHALEFGMGNESAVDFYEYLYHQMSVPVINSIILDFARLLPQPSLRIPLLKVHYTHVENETPPSRPSVADYRNKSYSKAITSAASSSSAY